MNVTILGINGFLSTAIAKYCNKKGWHLEMHGIGTPNNNSCDACFKVDLINGELDYDMITKSDIIVYAIGAGIQSNLKDSNDLIYNLNVTAPVKICNRLKMSNYKGIFITFGSVFEIGETLEKRLFSEIDIITSICPAPSDYVVSKRMLTQFVNSYKHSFTHWHFFIPTIYGAGENPQRLIPYTINAIRNNESLHFTDGNQVRQYVYVSEVPKIIDLAYHMHLPSGLYNIEGKETLTIRELVTKIHAKLGKEVPSDCFGTVHRTDVQMKYLALDGTKLKKLIGFQSNTKIEEVLFEY